MSLTDLFVQQRNNGTIPPDRVWQHWSNPKHPQYQDQQARFHWMCGFVQGPRVLDIGCSNGVGMHEAAQVSGVTSVVGVDVCSESLDEAEVNLELLHLSGITVTLRKARAEVLPFKDQWFNTVLLGEVLEHVEDAELTMKEAMRVLTPIGYAVITVPDGGVVTDDHLRVFTPENLREFCSRFGVVSSTQRLKNQSSFWLGLAMRRND